MSRARGQALRTEKKDGKSKENGSEENGGGKSGGGAQASGTQPRGKSKGQGKGDDKVNIPCFAFVRGETCRHGDQCRYVHAMPPSDVCWHWARGECKKGKNCKFKHHLEPKSEEKEKGVSTTEGAPAPVPDASKGVEDKEVPEAVKSYMTELKKMSPAVQAYYNELFKFERED